jgi:hypothetical protein
MSLEMIEVLNKDLDMEYHTYLITPQFIEEKSQENSNASRRDWFCCKTRLIIGTKGVRKAGYNIAN